MSSSTRQFGRLGGQGLSLWMASGGIQQGKFFGATDAFGFREVEDPVSVHDLNATIIYLMRYAQQRVTYRHAGRDS